MKTKAKRIKTRFKTEADGQMCRRMIAGGWKFRQGEAVIDGLLVIYRVRTGMVEMVSSSRHTAWMMAKLGTEDE